MASWTNTVTGLTDDALGLGVVPVEILHAPGATHAIPWSTLAIAKGSVAVPATDDLPMMLLTQHGGGTGANSAEGMLTLRLLAGGIAFCPLVQQPDSVEEWFYGSAAIYSRVFMTGGSADGPFESSFTQASDIQKFYRAAATGYEMNYANYSGFDDHVAYEEGFAESPNMTCGLALIATGGKHVSTALYIQTQDTANARHFTGIEIGADAIREGGAVINHVTITAAGAYDTVPAVTITPTNGASATAYIKGITSVTVVAGGTGYPLSTTMRLTATGSSGGAGFFGWANTNGAGVVTSVSVLQKGHDYSGTITVTPDPLTTGSGSGLSLTAVVSPGITGISFVSKGVGFVAVPVIGFTGGGGAGGGTATVTLYVPVGLDVKSEVPAVRSVASTWLQWQTGVGTVGGIMVDTLGTTYLNGTDWVYILKDASKVTGSGGSVSGIIFKGAQGEVASKRLQLAGYTTTDRDALTDKVAGLMIYNSTTGVMNFWNGTVWAAV